MTPHPDAIRFQRLDELHAEERTTLLEHARECAECRGRMAGDDPARLFALLALETPPPEALDRLSANLNRALDDLAPHRSARAWFRSVASIAAALALAGFLGSYMLLQSGPELTLSADLAARTEGAALAAYEAKTPPECVEVISSPGEAQVMELAIGNTQVVMIFDEALDI